MATLGAELGCERYLASTVVTGSGQRSGTFLAKLRRNSVFVLALRAFHCRPRRKKRARCTARVTSHMIGDKADALHDICPRNTAMLGGLIQLACDTRGERQPALWSTSSRSFSVNDCGVAAAMRPVPRDE